MKQNLAILILPLCLLTGILSFYSCHSDDTPAYRIGVSQCSDDAWRNKLNEEMQRELLFYPDVSLEVRSANDDNERQSSDIDYFIRQQVDLLVVSPNRADSLTPAVSKAFDAGIPVIVADRKVTGDKYTAFIGGDNLEVGKLQGQYLRMLLPEGGKVLELMGLIGSTPQELRHQGFMASLEGVEDRYDIAQCVGQWFQKQGEEEVEKALRQHPDIQIIVAQNDQMAIGASRAVGRLNLGHKVYIMGVDGLTGPGNGVEAILNGAIDVSATYATGGDLIIQTAMKILKGEPYERDMVLPTSLVDMKAARLLDNIYKEVDHEIDTVKMLKGRVDAYWELHNLQQTLIGVMLAFLVMSLVFLVVVYRNYSQKRRLNESLNRQKDLLREHRDQLAQQNEQLKQLTRQVEEAAKAKLMFFTNVSHDFRTPLTLIAAPLEQIRQKIENGTFAEGGMDEEANQLLMLAQKNVKVLQRLVNQVLDFRKLESGKLELNRVPVDLHESCQMAYDSFKGLAYKKHIRLEMKVEEGDYRTMADVQKLERVFFNLMGNAFKYTPENGRITVTMRTGNVAIDPGLQPQPCVIAQVADTGPGINVEHIQHIFENFYQIDSAHYEGSGIGLAVAKSFVELHNGKIEVANQPTGTGTIFTITIPKCEVNEDAQAGQHVPHLDAKSVETELGDVIENEEITENEAKPVVLVIDDNADLRQYLQMLLGSQYRVVMARDGQEGIHKAMRMVPDVIICDVMMPVMDGIECCRRLKREVNTCHIPVLMLTANAMDEQRIEGLQEGGADAYMAKPFNPDVLKAQLKALVDNHNRIRDFFGSQIGVGVKPADTAAVNDENRPAEAEKRTPSLDDKFLMKVKGIIEKNLGDSDFGVEQLGDMIGMSRAQLYRKTKALTNYSPVELIRNTRLKKAQQMLAQGDETIAQVAYSVGFTAPSYFTKCYKDYFGEMPNELVRRKGL